MTFRLERWFAAAVIGYLMADKFGFPSWQFFVWGVAWFLAFCLVQTIDSFLPRGPYIVRWDHERRAFVQEKDWHSR